MSAPENQSAATPAAGFTKTWRYKVGFTMIVVGNLGMLFAIVVLPFLGVGAGTVGVLVLGGEIISLTSMYKGGDTQTKDRAKKTSLLKTKIIINNYKGE